MLTHRPLSDALLVGILLALTATSGLAKQEAPLFADDAPLAITLAAPLSQTRSERDKSALYPGEVRWASRSFPVELTLRGNRRLSRKVCAFPPLRLNFDSKTTSGSVFEGQSDIKLVVQCREGELYADYLRAEYLMYKALNVLTPLSYQVRWVDVTYTDTDGEMKNRLEGAFFVERKGELAKRNGRKSVDVEKIGIGALDLPAAALLNLFQFVIANPDYSLTTGPAGDECCHNAKLVTGPTQGTYTPLIYDFDSSGAINTKYARPPAVLDIKKVTDRLYMGYCEEGVALDDARARILANQAQLIGVFTADPLLSSGKKSRLIAFLEQGFEILGDDARFKRVIVSRCR